MRDRGGRPRRPPGLPPLSSPPPHAATPRARAVRRQPEAATERTRKGSLLKERDTERGGFYGSRRTRRNVAPIWPLLSLSEPDSPGLVRGASGAPVARQIRREHSARC